MKVAILLRELKSNCIGSLTFNIKSLCLIESSMHFSLFWMILKNQKFFIFFIFRNANQRRRFCLFKFLIGEV